MGDEGGVMCHLTFDEEDATEVYRTAKGTASLKCRDSAFAAHLEWVLAVAFGLGVRVGIKQDLFDGHHLSQRRSSIQLFALRLPTARRPTMVFSVTSYTAPTWRMRSPKRVLTSEHVARCFFVGDSVAASTLHFPPFSAAAIWAVAASHS